MKPDNFEDISAVLGALPARPDGRRTRTPTTRCARTGSQEITPIHPELEEPLEEILGPTYGLIVYQEQVQRAAQILAGYSLGEADLLRRAMGKKKKEVLDKEFVPFRDGMRENGYSDEAIQAIWDVLVPFAGYAFNKAHSAGVRPGLVLDRLPQGELPGRVHGRRCSPRVGDDKDKMAIYLAECRRMGIQVLPPDVNESAGHFTPVGEGHPVRPRRGPQRRHERGRRRSSGAARRRATYADFSDFLSKVDAVVCNKRTVESLIKAGAFDSHGAHPQGPARRARRARSTRTPTSSATRRTASSTCSARFGDDRRRGEPGHGRDADDRRRRVGQARQARLRAGDARPVRLRPPALRPGARAVATRPTPRSPR